MLKREEQKFPWSCLNRAKQDEFVFVLLARDPAAPVAIREWVKERIRLGKNADDDIQIIEALHVADEMDKQREQLNKGKTDGQEKTTGGG